MRSAAVEKFPQPEEPVRKVVATGFSIVVGLTDDRQMTFQSGFEGDESDADVAERVDRMMRIADRQKARYAVQKAVKDLVKLEKTYADFLEDRTAIEARHVKEQAVRKVEFAELVRIRGEERAKSVAEIDAQILGVQEMRQERYNAALEQNRMRGRTGAYKPVGADKAALDNIDSGIKRLIDAREKSMATWDEAYDERLSALQAEIHRVEADRAQHADNMEKSVLRYEEAIAAAKEEIAEYREAVGT